MKQLFLFFLVALASASFVFLLFFLLLNGHESIVGSLITGCAALFAAYLAWTSVQRQLTRQGAEVQRKEDREREAAYMRLGTDCATMATLCLDRYLSDLKWIVKEEKTFDKRFYLPDLPSSFSDYGMITLLTSKNRTDIANAHTIFNSGSAAFNMAVESGTIELALLIRKNFLAGVFLRFDRLAEEYLAQVGVKHTTIDDISKSNISKALDESTKKLKEMGVVRRKLA